MIWEIEESRTLIEGLDEDGRPDPAYAAALGLRPAPLGRRALASLIEFAICSFLQLPYWIVALPTLLKVATGAIAPSGLVSHPNFVWMVVATSVSAALTLGFVIAQLVLHGKKGVTIGKGFMGIRSVNVATLAKPGFGRALLRGIVLLLSFLVPILGPVLCFVSPLFDSEKRGRGWLDLVGRTWFVDIRNGLDPFHAKRMRIARKTVSAAPMEARAELPSLATPAARMAQAYRPGARTSSGVVGAARPQAPGQQQVGLASQPAPEQLPAHTAPGMPAGGARLGGYRPGALSGQARAAEQGAREQGAVASPSADVVDSVPGRQRAVAAGGPVQPLAPMPSPVADETVIEVDFDRDPSASEVDERTVRRIDVAAADDDDLEVTRARPRSRTVVATLVFDTGDRLAITGAALIGRNPSVTAGEVVEHLLPIVDDTRSISKTHLLISASPLAAIDRASTNGSSVVRAGVEHPLAAGAAFPLAIGDVVRFGDRTVTIEPGSEGGAS